MLATFLSGAFMMALAVIGVIFTRTWRDTGDAFFGRFGAAFLLMALERVPLALFNQMKDAIYALYHDDIGRLLRKSVVDETLRYFDDFYKTINDPRAAKSLIIDECKK